MTSANHRRLLLLGLLHASEMHGYELHAHLSGTGLIELKRPAAYGLLDAMADKGWLEGRVEAEGGRERRVYSLTQSGHQAMLDLLREQLAADAPPDLPNTVSLIFSGLLPAEEARVLLEERRAAMVASLDDAGPDHGGISGKVLALVRNVRQAELALVDEVLAELGRQA